MQTPGMPYDRKMDYFGYVLELGDELENIEKKRSSSGLIGVINFAMNLIYEIA